ncbi:hypothetical protein MKW98_017245 [Papaver atlanticum]|uniref:Replication factor A C-terminal domain-containing protein n=1 Tax=Papaver atlanticum TaxID=357466 RepID=A0AAD4S411_9MAGN|nr:hypothetical protein MKW98_017245 [Papaver atlanticum]
MRRQMVVCIPHLHRAKLVFPILKLNQRKIQKRFDRKPGFTKIVNYRKAKLHRKFHQTPQEQLPKYLQHFQQAAKQSPFWKGLAYQLIDDVPAFTGTSASLGKADNVIMCNATTTNVLSISDWHFLACPRCNKKGLCEQGDLWCTKCEIKVDPSQGVDDGFMLRFEVKDHTGTTIFVALDNEIRKLVHQPEDEFIKDRLEETVQVGDDEADE